MGYSSDLNSNGVSLSQTDLTARKSALTAIQQNSSVPPRVVTLIGCQEDETWNNLTNCTISADTTNYKIGEQGTRLTISTASTAQARLTPEYPITHPPAAVVGMWVYIPDASVVSQVNIELWHDAGGVNKWIRTGSVFKNGWNLLRFRAASGMTTAQLTQYWGKGIHTIRFVIVTTAATNITLGHVWAECPSKAQILFIEDGGYTSWMQNGYPDLINREIPVTLAVDCTLFGNPGRISLSDVQKLAGENGNSMSIHGYDGTVTSTMTAAQIRSDCMKAIKWLEQQGYFGGTIWRAAWVQNSAPNAAAAQSLFLAYATPSSSATLASFPPDDQWNIPRISLHGSTLSDFDNYFAQMKATNQLMVCYTHGIDVAGGTNITPTNWSYFISKIDQGLKGGWIEGVTFETLVARSGIKFKQGMGDWVTELYKSDGSYSAIRLP